MHKIAFKQKEKVEKYFYKGKKTTEEKLKQKEKRIEIKILKNSSHHFQEVVMMKTP